LRSLARKYDCQCQVDSPLVPVVACGGIISTLSAGHYATTGCCRAHRRRLRINVHW
jgi:hypothetical protein